MSFDLKFFFQWDDVGALQCSTWSKFCNEDALIVFYTISILFLLGLAAAMIAIMFAINQRLYKMTKHKLQQVLQPTHRKIRPLILTIKCAEQDDEFVQSNFMTAFTECQSLKAEIIHPNSLEKIKPHKHDENGVREKRLTLVIFSPNYLTSAYRDVNIKKIRGEMLKAKKTIYVFVDIGPDNSIYAFLKEQRDYRTTLLWGDPKFWDHFRVILKYMMYSRHATIRERGAHSGDTEFSSLPVYPNLYAIDTFAHSQV